MEQRSSICILFFFFVCFFFFLSPIQLCHCFSVQMNVTVGEDLIEKACHFTPHADMCQASLQMDPNSGQADMEGLAVIALKVALANATDNSKHISQMLNNSTLDPFIEQCLSDCAEQYLDSIDQIEDALAAIAGKEYHDVNDWVNAAIANSETCEQGFTEKPGYESVVTQRNVVFKQLCLNALSITQHLQ